MEVREMIKIHIIVLNLLLFAFCGQCSNDVNVSQKKLVEYLDNTGDKEIINIGVIVDMGSWQGKLVQSCIKMAVKDFYDDNSEYNTRISLQIRDSTGDSLHSIGAAFDLLETVKVHALIVPVISKEELFMASLSDKTNVPLLSFSAASSLIEHPYYVQVAGDETIEFNGIATLSESLKWKDCIIFHEDTADARQVQLTLHNILLERNIRVRYHTPISLMAAEDQIVHELRKIIKMKTAIIIVHLTPSLASQVFVNAKMLGMMSKGFAWIVTSKAMNLLSLQDSSVHELMQGVLGFRSYFFASHKLQNFTLRWRNESNMEARDLSAYGIWAYDAVWALGHAMERAGIKAYLDGVQCNLLDSACSRVSDNGQALLNQISRSKFIGLAGVFELKNRKLVHETYEIVNVIGNGERRVGFWTSANGLLDEMHPSIISFSRSTLETIIWPGISVTTPASQLVHIRGNKLRVLIPSNQRTPKLVTWTYKQETDGITADGFCIDVFRTAFSWLNYNISFEFFLFDNGTYNDLIYQVFLQNYDAAVGDITIRANRSKYVDFTCPFTDLGVGMITKLDDKDPWFFLKPLDPDLWIMSACWFVVMGTIVWLIEHPINKEFQGSPAQQVGTILWFAVSTLVFAHREKLKSNISRFVVGICFFVVLILTSSYTANLSSLLTVQRFKLTKSDYIGSVYSLVEGHVVNNLNFDDDRLKTYQTAHDSAEALRRGSKEGGVSAVVDEIPYSKIFLAEYPNEFTISQTSMTTNGFGFAFPKGSSFVPELSRAIDGLREEGKLLEMEKKWFNGKSNMLSMENQQPSTNTLTFRNFSRLFLISGISEVLAILLFLMIVLREKVFRLKVLAVRRLLRMLRFPPRML